MAHHLGDGQTYRVFVSYSHDNAEHKALVREFCTVLRRDAGLDVHLDQWAEDSRRDWAAWALHQTREADFILAIASPAFRRRADGLVPSDEGRGAQFEAAILRDQLTQDLAEQTRRILPVVLPGRKVEEIPAFLFPYSATHYLVSELTLDGVTELLGAIHNVAEYPKPARGAFVGNPYARIHAKLQAEENAPAPPENVHGFVNHGRIENSVVNNGTNTHHGDIVLGTKVVHGGQER